MTAKLVKIPQENIRTHSPGRGCPEYITVSQDILFQVLADFTEHGKIRVSRKLFKEIFEVIDP